MYQVLQKVCTSQGICALILLYPIIVGFLKHQWDENISINEMKMCAMYQLGDVFSQFKVLIYQLYLSCLSLTMCIYLLHLLTWLWPVKPVILTLLCCYLLQRRLPLEMVYLDIMDSKDGWYVFSFVLDLLFASHRVRNSVLHNFPCFIFGRSAFQ